MRDYYRRNTLEIWMGAFIGALVLLIIVLCVIMYQEEQACKGRDGEMVGTGEYTPVVVVTSGMVYSSIVESYECTQPEGAN